MARSLIPAPWPVLHTPFSTDTVVDAHGNERLVPGTPVIRYVMAIYGGASSSDEMLSDEFLNDVKTVYQMVIPAADLGFYNSGDVVLIGGSVADGQYVGGKAFRLDGNPTSDLHGPWKRYYRVFGGYVTLMRVN